MTISTPHTSTDTQGNTAFVQIPAHKRLHNLTMSDFTNNLTKTAANTI